MDGQIVLTTLSDSIGLVGPELTLGGFAMVLLMYGVFRGEKAVAWTSWLTLGLFGIVGFLVATNLASTPKAGITAFGGSYILEPYAIFIKLLVLTGAGASILLSLNFIRNNQINRFEYPILMALGTLGMMLMASANDLITLYMGLELQSLALYVLAAFNRDSLRSTESGLKYFVLGAISSGLLLYGCSLLYGFTGTTNFTSIAAIVSGDLPASSQIGVIFGMTFLLAGLAFKISAVPFHMWTPDVYEGSPTPVTAFFAVAPKVAAMGLLIRVTVGVFPVEEGGSAPWQQIIVFISVASMVLGAFAAIGQTNIKRLMAYSSIGHMGFALVGLAAGTKAGVEGVLIYMFIYLFTVIGAFACILSMRRKEGMVENISDLSGMSRNHPVAAFFLSMLFFSLAGIPPLAGFFGKWFVFLPAIEAGFVGLAIIGVLASVVSAFYYVRVVKIIYFDEPELAFQPQPMELRSLLGIAGVFALLFFVFARIPLEWAEAAAASLFPMS